MGWFRENGFSFHVIRYIFLDLSLPLLMSQLFLSVDTLMLATVVGGHDGGGRTQIDPVRYIYIYIF